MRCHLILLLCCSPFQVTFDSNTAVYGGGALFGTLTSGSSVTTFSGSNTISNNKCTSSFGCGGAIELDYGADVIFNGQLCAQNNQGFSGGFALLTSSDPYGGGGQAPSTLTFNTDAALLGDNTPATIQILDAGSTVGCSQTGGSTSTWSYKSEYFITGEACACTQDFAAGTTDTCTKDCTNGWEPEQCACKVGEQPTSSTSCIVHHTHTHAYSLCTHMHTCTTHFLKC